MESQSRFSLIGLSCLFLLGSAPAFTQVGRNQLEITSLANEGFLLTSATHKVLIDALFSDGYGLFPVPSKEVVQRIMDGKAPFDNIEACVLTHYHKDHGDPQLINEYLGKHATVPLVTGRPSIVFINGNIFSFILLKKQFYEMTPETNQSVSGEVHSIPIKAFGLKHLSFYRDGIDMEENMVNVSFLLSMDGIKVFHSGDIEMNALRDYLAVNKRWTDAIDVAFLHFDLLNAGAQDLDSILAILHPKYIVSMHVPSGMAEEWSAKADQLRTRYPHILFFKNSLDTQTVTIGKER